MSNEISVKEAMQQLGGPKNVAKLVNAPEGSVYHWQSRGWVGPAYYLAFLDACKAAKIKVNAAEVMRGNGNDE